MKKNNMYIVVIGAIIAIVGFIIYKYYPEMQTSLAGFTEKFME